MKHTIKVCLWCVYGQASSLQGQEEVLMRTLAQATLTGRLEPLRRHATTDCYTVAAIMKQIIERCQTTLRFALLNDVYLQMQ